MKKLLKIVVIISIMILSIKLMANEPSPAERRERLTEIYGEKASDFIFYDL